MVSPAATPAVAAAAPAGGAPPTPPAPATLVAQLVAAPAAGAVATPGFVDSATLATGPHPEFKGGTDPTKAWTVPQIDALRAHLATLLILLIEKPLLAVLLRATS